MLVTFSSKAGADILMLSEHAKPILSIAGKVIDDPFPVRGVFSAEQLPDAIKLIERAIASEPATKQVEDDGDMPRDSINASVALRQRAFPLLDLMRRAQQTGLPVMWETGSAW